jgi:dTDP-4-dehydrorhamnose reductase
MKILISGGHGRFAQELIKQNRAHHVIALSKLRMDITDPDSIEASIKKYSPDVFIHAAALSRPMNIHNTQPDKSISLNIIGTANCVNVCMKYNVKLVYISTDYVYPGKTGNYSESDGVYPVNKYAWSKLGGECSVMMYDNSLILRTALTEYPFPHLKAFTDLYKSSIWHVDSAKVIYRLIEENATGIYNIGGERKSIYDFVSNEKVNILPISKNDVTEVTPSDISMDITKLNNILNDSII